ncbi:MAG: flagellar filament capping protein FliD [Lachnospiraceae bacterium]|nr:flagellar filament capping protein FliD [Lachnospiraceae bacterium]
MADLSVLNNIYNQINTTYNPMRTNTKYDTHKKSELRGVYNSIVEKSKDAPLFLLDDSKETKDYVVDLKENSRNLKNTIASLSQSGSTDDILSKKTIASSDDSKVRANYLGGDFEEGDASELTLSIKQLAGEQQNTGRFLPPDERIGLDSDTYSFDVHSRDMDYEFQFNISDTDTNKNIQDKLERLINRSNIGIKAEVIQNGEGMTSLSLTSEDMGVRNDEGVLFNVSDNRTSKASGVVEYLGLSNVSLEPKNAEFTLNGVDRVATGNHFTVDGKYDIELKAPTTEGESVTVGFKTDYESLAENIEKLIGGYNDFIEKANSYVEKQPNSKTLINEMRSITTKFSKGLEDLGVSLTPDSTIALDPEKLRKELNSPDALKKLETIKDFANTVLKKTSEVALDPMQYTRRRIVEYKNPGHNFSAPYVTSNYSGMMFSGYC